jgi:4-hydroxyphenylacetate 3-monooxygenase
MPADNHSATGSAADIGRYYSSATMTARDRIELLKIIWDLVGSEFGGRQLQYEMFASAPQHIADIQAFRAFDWRPGRAYVRRLLESD